MISESLDYLRNSDDVVRTVVIGGVLGFLGFLLVPTFFVLGYMLRVVRGVGAGDEEPPVFDEWGEMGIEGLKAFLIAFAWSLVPAVIGFVLVSVGFAGLLSNNSGLGAVGILLLLVSALVTIVLSLALAYLLPAAIANFAHEGDIAAGFDVATIRQVVTDRTYLRAWGYGFVILFGLVVAISVVNLVPLLGQLITFVAAPFATFYALVALYYLVGKAFAEIRTISVPGDDEQEFTDEQPVV
jgi:hypothetical protein